MPPIEDDFTSDTPVAPGAPSDMAPPTEPEPVALPRTNALVYSTGVVVGLISGHDPDEKPDAALVEAWIYHLREQMCLTTAELDWHYAGGYAVVQILPEHLERAVIAAHTARSRLTAAGCYMKIRGEGDTVFP